MEASRDRRWILGQSKMTADRDSAGLSNRNGHNLGVPPAEAGFTLKKLPRRIVSRPLKMREPFSLLAMAPAMASAPRCGALRRVFFNKLRGLRGERSSPPVSGATWVVRIAPQSLDQLFRPLGHPPAAQRQNAIQRLLRLGGQDGFRLCQDTVQKGQVA